MKCILRGIELKDRIRLWFMVPFLIVMTLLTDMYLNFDIVNLNQMIIDYVPYPRDNITCLGCCSLECLENALIKTVKFKILLPFFSVGLILTFTIIVGIMNYFEIQKEKEGLN